MDEKHELFLHVRLWLEDGDEFAMGPGRVHLLEEIRSRGSLHQAAKALSMSYRRAWGQIKKLEESLGIPLVAKTGSNKAGYELTAEAETLMAAYSEWERQVTRFALEKSRELFPDYVHASVGEREVGGTPKRRRKTRGNN